MRKVFFAMAALISLTAGGQVLAESPRLVITGKVVDSETGKGIQGVFLEIENASGGSGYSRQYTDAKGGFIFKGLPSGVSFNLYGEKKGFTSYQRLYWYVESGKELESIVVKLGKEAIFECRIAQSDRKKPVKRARVTLKPMGWREDQFSVYEFEREAGDNGLVRIERIPTGSYELIIEKPGYITEKLTNITFLAGRKKEMDVALYRPASISGKILLIDKETALTGIPIISRGPSQNTSTSNFGGEYSLRDLKPGTYGFSATRSGFLPYSLKGEIKVREGEDIRGINHYLTAEKENVKIAIYQEVYPLKKEIKFTVRAFRSEDFNLEFYRVPIRWYLKNPHLFKDLLKDREALEQFKKVHSDRFGFKRYRPYTWFTQEIKVEKDFAPGIYIIRAYTENAEDRNFIFISNIGVVVKRGKESLLAYAVNFENNQPEEGVEVFVLKSGKYKKDSAKARKNFFQRILGLFTNDMILVKGRTDKRGLYKADRGVPNSDILVAGLKADQGIGISESYLSPMITSEGAKYYFYTDRPVYRPGQRIFFKGVLRVDDGTELTVQKHHDIMITIKDPEGRVIRRLNRTSDEIGTVNGSIDLSSDAALGRYTLWVEKGGMPSSAAHFFVQAYRKPDYKVEVKTDKGAYVTDESIKCTIQAAYFFGSPLSNVSVSFNVYQKMTHKPYYRYWWEGEYYRREGYQSLIKTGKASTDAQGFVSVEIMPPPKSFDRIITVVAEVTAPSGRKVTGQVSVIYNQSLYQIEVSRPSFIHRVEQPLSLGITIRDINGNPVKSKFRASLEQEVWNPLRSRYEDPAMPLYEEEFETGENGKASVEIPVSALRPGYNRLVVTAVDPAGTKAVVSTSLWLYDRLAGDFNYNYAGLEVQLDKEDYRPGDTARLLINSPMEEGTLLFTMEGRDIMDYRVIPMTTRTRIIEIPVKESFSPNIWISALQHEGNRLYHKKVSLNVAVEGMEMTLETAFDKKEYLPGETARLDIKAIDQRGRPVEGDFSVGVVDEAIYYIRPDHTLPIHSYFYAKRSPWVSTSYSFPIRYLGGAVKDSGGRVIRKDFRDTAFWLPNVSTDKSGMAKVSIPFPDNLTTWVTTIRGHSRENIFGETRSKAIVTKPLVTSLKLPRFFIRGDRAEVRVMNYNRTEVPLEMVRNSLEVNRPLHLMDNPVKTIQIPKKGTGQLTWPVMVNKGPLESRVTIITVSDSLRDGEQLDVKVLPKGLPRIYDFSGRTQAKIAAVDIPVPKDHGLEDTSLEIEFTAHPAVAALTSLNYLENFPYGCVEQTLNSFIPMAAYYEALTGIGVSLQDMDQLRLRIEKGLLKIKNYQREDGAFGWWKGSEADLYLTSLVMLGVSKLHNSIYKKTREAIISKAAEYVKKDLMRTQVPDLMAFGLYALSEAGYEDIVLARSLKSRIRDMDALALSFTAPVLANHKMQSDAEEAADLLISKIQQTPDGSYFPEPEYNGNRNSIETTACALAALIRIRPEHPEIDQVLRWLVTQKTGPYWVSTKTTGFVVLALSEYIRFKKDRISFEDQDISMSINGRKVSDLRVSGSDYLKGRALGVSFPPGQLIHGKNTLSIVSEHDIYYALRMKSFMEKDTLTPGHYNCGITVAKKLFAITRVHDSRGNPRILSRPLEQGEKLNIGDEIRVEVRFSPDRDYDYFILEDGLPSGFDVVDFNEDTGMLWWQQYSHKERRDEKVVFFFDHLYKDREVTADYVLRSEMNGEFHMPPAKLFAMYKPSIYSHSGSRRLTVGSFKKVANEKQ